MQNEEVIERIDEKKVKIESFEVIKSQIKHTHTHNRLIAADNKWW